MNEKILIRRLRADDCEIISKAFAAQNWEKPATQYESYLKEQTAGRREVLVAEFENELAGYLTIMRPSDFAPFREKGIPEIVDFNVLIKFRNRGIGGRLLDAAESLLAENHQIAGIRVGLTRDYGAAQRLYVKRGYLPDGLGISQNGRFPAYGDKMTIDDDLALSFTKELKSLERDK
jgi:ribosomal protein S18 acetylase RimI-like enzyme